MLALIVDVTHGDVWLSFLLRVTGVVPADQLVLRAAVSAYLGRYRGQTSPADYVRRPTVPAESPTLGLGHLQFAAVITTARLSTNPNDFALIALVGLLGLRIFEACGANIADLGKEHGHRVLRVRGKGGKVVLVPLPPAVAATRRLKHLAATAGVRMPRMHPPCFATRS
jgi:integrase